MRGLAILPSGRWPLRRSSREEARLLARNDGSPGPDGVFRPEAERKLRAGLVEGIERRNAERSVMDDIAAEPEREFPVPPRVLAEPKADAERHAPGERPYADITDSQLAAYRLAAASEGTGPRPSFRAARGAAPETRPMPALSASPGAPVTVPAAEEDAPEVVVLRKVLDGLNGLDWPALDAARENERETYARTAGAPFCNALLKERRTPLGDPQRPAWRPPAAPVRRHGDALQRRLGDLEWPAVSGFTAPGADARYAELLRRVSLITGTTGIGNWRPVPGGAR